jgi:hypothetical protein
VKWSAEEQDSGLGVRKRVIKLLKGIFGTTGERNIKVDIVCKMITLIGDTDENIQASCLLVMLYPTVQNKESDLAGLLVDVVADFPSMVILESGFAQVSLTFLPLVAAAHVRSSKSVRKPVKVGKRKRPSRRCFSASMMRRNGPTS